MMDTGKVNRRPAPQQWPLGFPAQEPPTHLPSSPPCLPMAHRTTLWPIRVTDSAPTPATPMLPRSCSKIAVLSVTPQWMCRLQQASDSNKKARTFRAFSCVLEVHHGTQSSSGS